MSDTQHTDHTEHDVEHPGHAEHLVLITVVKAEQWHADPKAVLNQAQATLAQRAQRRGLRLQGEPHEEIEVLSEYRRVRITLIADAVPAESIEPDEPVDPSVLQRTR